MKRTDNMEEEIERRLDKIIEHCTDENDDVNLTVLTAVLAGRLVALELQYEELKNKLSYAGVYL